MPKPHKSKKHTAPSGTARRSVHAEPRVRQGLGKVGRARPAEPRVRQGSEMGQSDPAEPGVSTPPQDRPPIPLPPANPSFPEPSERPQVPPVPLAVSPSASAEPAAAEERFSSEIIATIQESRDDYLRVTIALDQLSQQQTLYDTKLTELETRLNNLRNQ